MTSEHLTMTMRGRFTEEIKEKYGILNVTELRLIPYLQYLLINHESVDPAKITSKERDILKKWSDEGKISFSMLEPCTCTKEFWDLMNAVLWDTYVPQKEEALEKGEEGPER